MNQRNGHFVVNTHRVMDVGQDECSAPEGDYRRLVEAMNENPAPRIPRTRPKVSGLFLAFVLLSAIASAMLLVHWSLK